MGVEAQFRADPSTNGGFIVSIVMIVLASAFALGLAWWLFQKPGNTKAQLASAATAPMKRSSTASATPARPSAPARAAEAAAPDTPAELAVFQWLREEDMDPAKRDALVKTVQGIPRPPRSMQQLLSTEFVSRASSTELSELLMSEPMIAARVLSTVNSPFYGLHKPVTNIGQSVTFLGMNTVRSICLQYMLAEAFKPKLAEAQRSFDAIWRASAIASELSVRLAKALNLPDQGSLATQVVLSFVGQLATASLVPPAGLEQWLSRRRLERARLEQELLGLNASELGGLLMKTWGLPESLIDEVGGIGRQLVTPASRVPSSVAPRYAIGYLSARLGEQLALGHLENLEGYDPMLDICVDTHHLRGALAHPSLSRLEAVFASPEFQSAVAQMLATPAPA